MGRSIALPLLRTTFKTPVDALASGRHRFGMDVTAQIAEQRRAELIRSIATSRERAAFVTLFEFYGPRIKSQAMRFGLSPDAAEDVVQDAMLAVWNRAAQFDEARGCASAWVFTIATNARIDRLRRDRRRTAEVIPELVDTATPETFLAQSDEADILSAAMTGLTPDQRRIVELSFYQDTPHAAIAARLNIPLGTVKSRVRLALKRLRTLLGDDQ